MDGIMQFAIAALVAHVIERAKLSRSLAWIGEHTDGITKITAAVIAFLSAVGITYTWDPATGTAALSGIPTTLSAWTQLLTHAFMQYWLQKGYYLTAIKPNKKLGEMMAEVETIDAR